MSENNPEKTEGRIASDLINQGLVSKEIVESHKKFDNDPTLPPSAITNFKDLAKIRKIKPKS